MPGRDEAESGTASAVRQALSGADLGHLSQDALHRRRNELAPAVSDPTQEGIALATANSATPGLVAVDGSEPKKLESKWFMDMPKEDKEATLLLILLYMLQGIPVGLAFGTMPYLLKQHLSYSDIGIFMLCTYPYSLKLLWSPIVDTLCAQKCRIPCTAWTLSLGRRKSWIVPVQLAIGVMLYVVAMHVDAYILGPQPNVYLVTGIFFALITLAATQDIAVDGWALTLLSEENVGYASTAQTIGVNIGYFMSFTVFLAFNSVEFSNKYFRALPLDYPLLSLAAYLKLCSGLFLLFTTWLLFFKKEQHHAEAAEMDVGQVYSIMWRICQLKHVRLLMATHLIAKIGFQTNEAVTGLKLVEHGLGKEDLAFAVLIDFPFQIVFGYMAAAWSRGDRALQPWLHAFVGRLVLALVSMATVYGLPSSPSTISNSYFLLIIVSTVLNSFAATVQFVGISAFHTQIADPVIGGTYMTLLNTVSNLGGTWPRYFVLKLVDFLSISECEPPSASKIEFQRDTKYAQGGNSTSLLGLGECVSDAGKARCDAVGGTCHILRDGYYWTNITCVVIGAVTLFAFILPVARRLQKIPNAAWRVSLHKEAT
ncbi:hypothetical protein MVES_000335 [Malassezia vespertilionis]|uniref:Uncharacterized protein n=2 Tax=Malassezia vespertilionis TaxID=2020962 RepID=A0A2N1JFY0_9BASI|nr:hypothetical protein MVES_000335 [Malassezia vespertilionis]